MAQTSPARTAPANPADADAADHKDWPAQATETIVTQVGNIRDKTTGPVLKAARYAVFAAFAISLGTVALVLFVIGAVRALDNYLPGGVWAAHTLLGGIFLLIGFVLFLTKARAET